MQFGNTDQLVQDYVRTLHKSPRAAVPILVGLVGGLGSGKSYLASQLAADFDMSVLAEQDIKNFFLPRREFLNQGEDFLISFLTKSAQVLLWEKVSVVTDINLAMKKDRNALRQIAALVGVKAFMIHVYCRKETAFKRVSDRNVRVSGGSEKGELFSNDYFELDFSRIEDPVDVDLKYNSEINGEYDILKAKIRAQLKGAD